MKRREICRDTTPRRKMRRNSRRERNHIKHAENDGEEQDASPQMTREHGLMPVTCGSKTGLLDTAKLRSGEECIDCDGCWFAPSAFEELGGKGASKKWKASILYQNKPLQTLFDKKLLTTEGYLRRSKTMLKSERLLSSCCSSDSSSADFVEESEEDDAKDDDWSPVSQDPKLETKKRGEERVEAENVKYVVDSEDETGNRGTEEDDDKPDAAVDEDDSNGSCICEETEKQQKISPSGKRALLTKVHVAIKRLPESVLFQMGLHSNCTEHLLEDTSACATDEAETEGMREHSGSEIDLTAAQDDSEMSDVSPIDGDVGGNDDKLPKTDEGKRGERGESPGRASTAAPSSPGISAEDTGSLNHRPDDLSSSPQPLVTDSRSDSVYDMMDEEGEDEELDEIQELNLETRPGHSEQVERPCSAPLSSPNQARREMDELRREKIKMQLRVLRLQEEYYTLKIQKMNN